MKNIEKNQDYVRRINRVLDYIDKNSRKKISLDDLAKIAAFSPYHFHRIFRDILGEPVNKYLKRFKIEKAANLLLMNQDLTITEVANECGFLTSAELARSFKQFYKMSATEWRRGGYNSQKEKAENESFKEMSEYPAEISLDNFCVDPISYNQIWKGCLNGKAAKIEVKHEIKKFVAYTRLYGEAFADNEDKVEKSFNKLVSWGKENDLINLNNLECIMIMHDNPHITKTEKLKIDICLVVSKVISTSDDIGFLKIGGGLFAVGYFEILEEEIHSAWDFMGNWLHKKSAYIQDNDRKNYMVYKMNNFAESKVFPMKIFIPVKYS